MDANTRRSIFSKNRSKSAKSKESSKIIIPQHAMDPKVHRKASKPKHRRTVTSPEYIPNLKSKNFVPSPVQDVLLVTSLTYHVYQFDAFSRAFDIPFAKVTEYSLSKPTIKVLQTSNFSYINKLNVKYTDCIFQREQLEYLAASNGQPSKFDIPSNLFSVTLLSTIAHQSYTIYIFLQVGKRTKMARLIVFGSTKIKSTSPPSSDDLSVVKATEIKEVFELTKDTKKYKQFVKKYKIKTIYLFNGRESVKA